MGLSERLKNAITVTSMMLEQKNLPLGKSYLSKMLVLLQDLKLELGEKLEDTGLYEKAKELFSE